MIEGVSADSAYEAHAELVKLEAANPRLKANPYWKALRDAAYARFKASMERQL